MQESKKIEIMDAVDATLTGEMELTRIPEGGEKYIYGMKSGAFCVAAEVTYDSAKKLLRFEAYPTGKCAADRPGTSEALEKINKLNKSLDLGRLSFHRIDARTGRIHCNTAAMVTSIEQAQDPDLLKLLASESMCPILFGEGVVPHN